MNLPLAEEWATGARVLRLAHKERTMIFIVALLSLASAIFEGVGLSFLIPLAMMLTGGEMDFGIPVIGPLLALLDTWIGLDPMHLILFVFGFFFLGIVVGYVNVVLSNILAMGLAHRMRVRVFETALERPLARIESMPSGKFVNNLASETWRVSDATFVVINIVVQSITCLVFFGFLLLLSPFYTAILIAMTLVMATVVHLATRAVKGMGAAALAANEGFMAYVWDALAGLRVIRGFGREAHERVRFSESSGRVSRIFVRLGIVSGLVGPITQLMTVAMVGTILGMAILRGDPVTTLVGFLAIAYRMQPRVSGILSARTTLRSLDASVAEVEKAVSEASPAPRPVQPFRGLRRGVVIENVSARYPKAERPALHDISCTFPYGQVTAVAGYSGAGKSTLVALLLRFIEPEHGRILIDGVPLSEIEPESWHRRIAFVEQNAFLFNASVRDNIGYGDLEAGFDAIREAARIAQADGFIDELPQGYDTFIGEHGVRLSQGQRQRIALARSLLRKPDVLILDEATNALDRPTEHALRAAIEEVRDGRAVIVIAHRRETIENADNIVVLDHGRVVEAGRPADLARRDGVYARLYVDELRLGEAS
jgi:ATP-binding cassette, subfamily B, bacterial MsbA